MTKATDLAGQRFGKLTAVSRAENTTQGRAQWRCRCDCGGEKIAQAAYLNKGTTRSCGCLGDEQRKAAAQSQCHDAAKRQHPREYSSWQNMIARCHEPSSKSFAAYGGRGISVCPRWRESFACFLADMGERPPGMSIDRRTASADYSTENCRWATAKEQANNRRNNRIIEHGGLRLTLAQWSERTGISHACLTMRLKRGWPVHRALAP